MRISHLPVTKRRSVHGQLKCIQAWPSLNDDTLTFYHSVYECVRACSHSRMVVVCVCVRVFTSVRCIDVSCACAVTSRVRAQPSCVCVHERACASTSRVRVHRVRVVTSVRAR